MTSEMKKGNLYICDECINTIREIESYVWDPKKALLGQDAPLKKDDHSCDALRYCIASHKVRKYGPGDDGHNPEEYFRSKISTNKMMQIV